MSELEAMNKSYQEFAFIHEILSQRTQYFVNEFEIAKGALQTITTLANKLGEDIKAMQPASESKEVPTSV